MCTGTVPETVLARRAGLTCDRGIVVDDDLRLRELLKRYLGDQGFNVKVVNDATQMDRAILREHFDLMVLDLMLPDGLGLPFLKALRARGDVTPVIILTARDEEVDTILGLELGADDYMTKPFRVRELLTRVKSQLRRAYGDLADAMGGRVIRAEDLVIDLERRKVTRGGARIALTPTEFEILRILAEKPGRVFARRDLLERVRDYDAAIAGDEKTINVHVSHLRDKVEPDPNKPRFVLTVRGVGYSFSDRSDRGERSGA